MRYMTFCNECRARWGEAQRAQEGEVRLDKKKSNQENEKKKEQ